MSWNIYIYAEVKSKNADAWKPLTNRPVHDFFKEYRDGFYDNEIGSIDLSEVSIDTVKDVLDGQQIIKCCSLKDFTRHYNEVAENYIALQSSVYTALGLDEGDVCEDPYYTEKDCPWVKYMTFPVNKRLIDDLSIRFESYWKAERMLALGDILYSMCDNYDDEIRLLFVVM